MATYNFDDLKEEYNNFEDPIIVIKIQGKDIGSIKKGYPVSDITIDLTSGYEASVAEFTIYNAYDQATATFNDDSMLEKYTTLGAKVEIALGYAATAKTIFVGAIMRVNFQHDLDDVPGIRITAMDVKGVMMASSYSKQLTATYYSAAVKEILERKAYANMQSAGMISGIYVTDTPDKTSAGSGLDSIGGDSIGSMGSGLGASSESEASDKTIEMVAESDYEFVVKVAKRYNYEFYTECGAVIFRKAKADTSTRMEISPATGMYSFDISYDVTGLVNKVIVRAADAARAQVIESEVSNSDYSLPSKAKSLIKASERVYIDGSVTSQEEAEYRAQSIMENIAYRFGSLDCELVGIPEYLPGYFIELKDISSMVNNKFYITRVIHRMSPEGKYTVKLEGKAAEKE